MKDITTTSFGLIIAYLLPGFVGLYGMSFWFSGLRQVYSAFLTAQSTVGLFLLVVVAALVAGLVVNSLRWAIYESWRCDGLSPDELAKLGADEKILNAYLQRIDENFRYYQFSAGFSIGLPILYAGWLSTSWPCVGSYLKVGSLLAFLAVEVVSVSAGVTAYGRYLDGSRRILTGR
jgi:hypothetical protein